MTARVPKRPVYRQKLIQVGLQQEGEGDARKIKKEKRVMMAANSPVLLSLVIPVRLSSKLAGVHQCRDLSRSGLVCLLR